MPNRHDELIRSLRQRAVNLYDTRQLLCSEAVLVTFNEVFGGGLTRAQAVALAAAFPVGVGGEGCLCGAVAGGALALGLFIAGDDPIASRREAREASAKLHRAFRELHGSACCRVLIKKVKDDKPAHFKQCSGITGAAAEATARILLEHRPDLAAATKHAALSRRDNLPATLLRRATALLCRLSRA